MSTQAEKKPKIVTVTSGKGGVGKSIIVANMANIMARQGYKVAVLDASLGLANLDIIFNVKVKKNLFDFLSANIPLQEITQKVKENLWLVPTDSGDEIFYYQPQDIYDALMQQAAFWEQFDFCLIDTASGIGKNVEAFLHQADEVVVVTVPDPSAITDAYALIKLTATFNHNINLIVNMTESMQEGDFIYQKISKVAENNFETPLLLNYLGAISFSKEIARSARLRRLFSDTHKNSLSSQALEEIVENITMHHQSQPTVKKPKKSLTRFFKRMMENF